MDLENKSVVESKSTPAALDRFHCVSIKDVPEEPNPGGGGGGDTKINSLDELKDVQGSSPRIESTGLGQGEGNIKGLMLIVGPEGLANKALHSFEAINKFGVKIKTTQQLKPENAGHWKNEDVAYMVFVIDSSDPIGLKGVDDQLSYLERNYVFPFDRINFLLAQEPDEGKTMVIKPSDVASFMAKFGQPLISIVFNLGWESDPSFHEQMRMFMNRFQILAGTSPDPDSNDSSQSQ